MGPCVLRRDEAWHQVMKLWTAWSAWRGFQKILPGALADLRIFRGPARDSRLDIRLKLERRSCCG